MAEELRLSKLVTSEDRNVEKRSRFEVFKVYKIVFLLCFFLILEKFVYLVDWIYCFASCLSRVLAFLEIKNHVESLLNHFVFSFSFFLLKKLSVLVSVKSLWTALAQETGAAERRSGASGQPRTTETGGLLVKHFWEFFKLPVKNSNSIR